jgi:hypothetical protein
LFKKMLDFQKYQLEFTSHLRDPKMHAKPANVSDTQIAVYREIVFNNIFGSVSACFPVCRQVLGKSAWPKLIKIFFATHQSTTPLFREIPQEFLKFLANKQDIPIYIQQLAHYEWVELAVNMQAVLSPQLSPITDVKSEIPVLAVAHKLLEYDFPVHKISKKNNIKNAEKTYFLVFRNDDLKVKFIELNPMTYILLNSILENNFTGEQALASLAEDMQLPDKSAIIGFGLSTLQELVKQQAITGSRVK